LGAVEGQFLNPSSYLFKNYSTTWTLFLSSLVRLAGQFNAAQQGSETSAVTDLFARTTLAFALQMRENQWEKPHPEQEINA
jgi:hypothetical protein